MDEGERLFQLAEANNANYLLKNPCKFILVDGKELRILDNLDEVPSEDCLKALRNAEQEFLGKLREEESRKRRRRNFTDYDDEKTISTHSRQQAASKRENKEMTIQNKLMDERKKKRKQNKQSPRLTMTFDGVYDPKPGSKSRIKDITTLGQIHKPNPVKVAAIINKSNPFGLLKNIPAPIMSRSLPGKKNRHKVGEHILLYLPCDAAATRIRQNWALRVALYLHHSCKIPVIAVTFLPKWLEDTMHANFSDSKFQAGIESDPLLPYRLSALLHTQKKLLDSHNIPVVGLFVDTSSSNYRNLAFSALMRWKKQLQPHIFIMNQHSSYSSRQLHYQLSNGLSCPIHLVESNHVLPLFYIQHFVDKFHQANTKQSLASSSSNISLLNSSSSSSSTLPSVPSSVSPFAPSIPSSNHSGQYSIVTPVKTVSSSSNNNSISPKAVPAKKVVLLSKDEFREVWQAQNTATLDWNMKIPPTPGDTNKKNDHNFNRASRDVQTSLYCQRLAGVAEVFLPESLTNSNPPVNWKKLVKFHDKLVKFYDKKFKYQNLPDEDKAAVFFTDFLDGLKRDSSQTDKLLLYNNIAVVQAHVRLGIISPIHIRQKLQTDTALPASLKETLFDELLLTPEYSAYRVYQLHSPATRETSKLNLETLLRELGPARALEQLEQHLQDLRQHLYIGDAELELRLETADSHDPLFNAIQRKLCATGVLNPLLLPYYSQRMLLWSKHYLEALNVGYRLLCKYLIGAQGSYEVIALLIQSMFPDELDLHSENAVTGSLQLQSVEFIKQHLFDNDSAKLDSFICDKFA